MAVKRVNRKRIELTREVLFELKHVMWGGRQWPGEESRDTVEVGQQNGYGGTAGYPRKGWGL